MKKIFYFWPEVDTFMYRWQREHFFDELRRYDICIEAFNPLIYNSWEEANEVALRTIKSQHFDLFMTDITGNENNLYVNTLQQINKMGIPTLWFRADNLAIPFVDKALASHFDLVWLTARETKSIYDKWGANTIFAPYAANPFNFDYHEMPVVRKVCFIGTPYGSRTRMMNTLLKHGIDLAVFYGRNPNEKSQPQEDKIFPQLYLSLPEINKADVLVNRLRFKEGRKLLAGTLKNKFLGNREIIKTNHLFRDYSVDFEKICYKYSEYALSLASTSAVHTDVLKKPLKIINLRNFEIPMSGGIEFCRYNPELSEYYEDGKEIIFYSTDEELVDKGKYYTKKATDNEILTIKKAARSRSVNEHSWYCRFKKVLNELEIQI